MSTPSEKRRIDIFIRLACRVLIATTILAFSAYLFAAEKPAPKSDPILADLKATAEAQWQPEFAAPNVPEPPSLEIVVKFQGTAAARASAFGELKLESVLDEHGKSYRWACVAFRGGEMAQICRKLDFSLRHGDGVCLSLKIPNRPPIQSIRELRGSLALQTGGEYQNVVVKNAFKDLEKPVQQEKNTVVSPSPWRGKPVQDKNLNALGIKLTTQRQSIPNWNFFKKIKDNIAIEVKSNDPVTHCEILDADGKPIFAVINTRSGRSPCWLYGLQTKVVIPPDAQLRLTIHKNSRKIRVPFAIKDIAVPKIAEGEKYLDIPALPENAFVEAETVPPGDPILAGLKFNAKANWRPWANNTNPPDLVVNIKLQGKAAKETSSYGEIDVESTLDESGNPLVFPNDAVEMKDRFCDRDNFSVELELPASPPIRKIRELRGTMALQTGGRFEVVTVKALLDKINEKEPIDDETLKSLGIVVKVEHRKNIGPEYGGGEALNVELQWKRNAIVLCDVLDKEGRPPIIGYSSIFWTRPRQMFWGRSFKENIPQDAQLRLIVQKDSRKIRVPFALKDIEVPPMPDEQDGTPGFGVPVPMEEKK